MRLRRRDPESVGLLYDRYGRTAYSLALKILGDAAKAESVVAEAVLRCWNKIANFRETRGGALGIWLLASTYTNALEQLGKTTGKAIDSGIVFQDWAKNFNADRAQDIYSAWLQLDKEELQVLELAFFEGLNPGEMAERLSIAQSEVNLLIGSALSKVVFITEE